MCYDVSTMTKKAQHYAKRYGDESMWKEIQKKYPPTYHVNGFSEPDLPLIRNDITDIVQLHHWAFVPFVYAKKINGRPMNTLNARDDKIFSSRSVYKKSAAEKRCLVMIDGFFDHHKKDGIAYPYYIQLNTKEPFMVAGLWQSYESKKDHITLDTVTLVTAPANKEMAWIHNEPAYSPESRMIYIVKQEDDETWLHGTPEEAKALIQPLPDDALTFHACYPIKSNKKLNRIYLGNDPQIQQPMDYPALNTLI